MEYTYSKPNAVQSNCRVSMFKNISSSFSLSYSFPRCCTLGALKISFDVSEISDFSKSFSKVSISSFDKQTFDKKVQIDCYLDSSRSPSAKDQIESERRRKIGLANKGRVPWNKGIKRTAETRELIRQKTIEALRDPKVRKKMSEHPCPHSDQIKAKISSSLRRIWGERLKWKRLREKFYISWAQSIATSAKKGGNGQEELEWNSFDKIKQEINFQQLQRAAEKAKAKEMVKIRAERRKHAKEEKMAGAAQKRKEREAKAKTREQKGKTPRKSRIDKKESAMFQDFKLKQRLKKIHKIKSMKVQVNSQRSTVISHIPAWDTLDLELVKREKMQIEASLADQIRAAKNRRAEAVPICVSSSQKSEG